MSTEASDGKLEALKELRARGQRTPGRSRSQEVGTVMWGWGPGRWVVGAVFMIFCMVMMARMMGGMMGHGHSGHSSHGGRDDPERTLADRLAKGEIDAEEYERLLEILHDNADHSVQA